MSLEDVARSLGSSDVADFLRVGHNDDGTLKSSALGGYISLGQTRVDVTGSFANDIPAAIAAEGHGKQFIVSSPTTVTSSIKLGDYDELESVRAATITADPTLNDHLIQNVDPVGGNSHITLKLGTVSGNRHNRTPAFLYDAVHFERVTDFDVRPMVATGADRYGYYFLGNTLVTNYGRATGLRATDSGSHGFRVSSAMRLTQFAGLISDNNGGDGYLWDASECQVNGASADSNTGGGHTITNVFGCTLAGLRATRNAKWGITAWSMIACLMTDWYADHNSKGNANTYDEIALLVTALAGYTPAVYGPTENTLFSNIWAGYDAGYGDTAVHRYNLYVENGHGTDVAVRNLHLGVAGQTGYIRQPTDGSVLIEEAS